MADRVRELPAAPSPVLLLTATPIQNTLAELWGLVQYVEPTGTLLGDLADLPRGVLRGRRPDRCVPGQEHELQRRLGAVLQRTLRRQAQEFLERPVHASAAPALRVHDEPRRAVALRRRDRVPARAALFAFRAASGGCS